jgi:hypothetical protein
MDPAELTHGVYIVYWTAPELRPTLWRKEHPDAGLLDRELNEHAQQHRPRKYVDVVVFDIGPPDR